MPKQSEASNYQEILTKTLQENYQKIILAVLVLLVGLALLSKPSDTKKNSITATGDKETAQEMAKETKPASGDKYTVRKGETLWAIAEKNYDSGYAWSEIAKANRLANPHKIEVGQVLSLPTVMVKKTTTGSVATTKPQAPQPKTGKVTITGNTYTVVRGDHLWSIAVRAYGDGYAWVRIARENRLKNPGIIHQGNVLKLPR